MSVFERVANHYLEHIWHEGERLAKLKTLSISLEILRGARNLTLLSIRALTWFTLVAASFGSAVLYLAMTYVRTGHFRFDGVVFTLLGIGIIALVFLRWQLSERQWLSAFRISEKLNQLQAAPRRPNPPGLESIVAELVQEKLAQAFANQAVKAREAAAEPRPPIHEVRAS
ncbi:MAG: hypothetical protein AB7P04_05365 [Bacteriovoracia bacterium]